MNSTNIIPKNTQNKKLDSYIEINILMYINHQPSKWSQNLERAHDFLSLIIKCRFLLYWFHHFIKLLQQLWEFLFFNLLFLCVNIWLLLYWLLLESSMPSISRFLLMNTGMELINSLSRWCLVIFLIPSLVVEYYKILEPLSFLSENSK